MPFYLYENVESGEVVEVLQGMNDLHQYDGEDGTEKGLWRRVFVNPNLSLDSQIDPFSQKDFIKKTRDKNDTYGNLQDRAAEASEQRAAKLGYDPVKQKYYENYAKERGGKAHPQQMKEKAKAAAEKASKKGINIEF